MNGQKRSNIAPGLEVDIVLKQDQRNRQINTWNCKRYFNNLPLPIHMALKYDCRTGKSVEYKISFNKKKGAQVNPSSLFFINL